MLMEVRFWTSAIFEKDLYKYGETAVRFITLCLFYFSLKIKGDEKN